MFYRGNCSARLILATGLMGALVDTLFFFPMASMTVIRYPDSSPVVSPVFSLAREGSREGREKLKEKDDVSSLSPASLDPLRAFFPRETTVDESVRYPYLIKASFSQKALKMLYTEISFSLRNVLLTKSTSR